MADAARNWRRAACSSSAFIGLLHSLSLSLTEVDSSSRSRSSFLISFRLSGAGANPGPGDVDAGAGVFVFVLVLVVVAVVLVEFDAETGPGAGEGVGVFAIDAGTVFPSPVSSSLGGFLFVVENEGRRHLEFVVGCWRERRRGALLCSFCSIYTGWPTASRVRARAWATCST